MFETYTYDDPVNLPPEIRSRWEFMETSSASAVLRSVCPQEWRDIIEFLGTFALSAPTWLARGGNRGQVPQLIDSFFAARLWSEIRVDLETKGILLNAKNQIVGELPPVYQEGYLVDNFKGKVALDVEWNAKDGNLDRDLAAYRAWHEAGVISAAVLITQDRARLKALAHRIWSDAHPHLAGRLPRLPIDLNTSTTTNFEKAALRVRRGVMGTCPLLIIAATENTWDGHPLIVQP